MTHRSALFAAVLGLGRAGSNIGDHLVQSDYCARVKGATDDKPVHYATSPDDEPTVHGTADGIKACAWHCLTYTATQAVAVGAGARVLGIRLHPGAAAAALALSFVTHYAADRRVPGGLLEKLATKTGKTNFWRLADHGLNGAYCIDILCTNGRFALLGGRRRRALNLQNDGRSGDGSVFVHRDHLPGLKVLPLGGDERSEPYRGLPTGL